MSLRPTPKDWRLATRDFRAGLAAWQLWSLLGISDIRQRYKRSRFGQFWITLSMAIFIAGIGVVYAFLFKMPIHEYIPYLAVNYIFWTFISGVVVDSTTVFTQATVYLRQESLPKTIFVLRLLVRNGVALAHNLILLPVVFALFGVWPFPALFLVLPGFVLVVIAAYLVALVCGVLCTRFRDMPQIIQNLLQVAFFITPIMWHSGQLAGRASWIVLLNPFATFLSLVAEPVRGVVPSGSTYLIALGWIAVLALITAPLFARFRARIVYWL